MRPRPPRLAESLASLSVDPADRDAVLGDLAEEFGEICQTSGPKPARRWYWRQVLTSLGPNVRRRLPALSLSKGHRAGVSLPTPSKEPIMNAFLQDLRFGWRMMRRRPLVTGVAVTSLVVGLSASVLVFGLLNAAVLRPLPVTDPDRLAVVLERRERNDNHNFSYADYVDFRGTQRVFTDLIAYTRTQVTLGRQEGSELFGGELVTGGYFQTLGIRMRMGRGLGDTDDRLDGPPVVVVSDALWRHLGAPAALDGWSLSLNGQTFGVVGVTAAPFRGTQVGRDTRVWAPLRYQRVLAPSDGRDLLARPTASWLTFMGRLRPDTTLEQAAGEFTRIESGLPRLPNRSRSRQFVMKPGDQGDSMLAATLASPLQLLLAAAGLVLLVACANVAGLLIARATERERELAVRRALGASRTRLASLLMTEALLLGAAATAVALGVTTFATRLAVPLLSRFGESVALDVSPDWRVLAFAGGLGLAASICFGLIPLAAMRRSLSPALGESGRSATASRGKAFLRRGLVAGQFALSLALVVVAVLLGRTLYNLRTLPTGFDLHHLAVVEVDPAAVQYSADRIGAYVETATARLASVPGVRAVAYARILPLDFGGSRTSIEVPGYTAAPDEDMEINFNRVTARYFETMGISPRDGRVFDASDVRGAPLAGVINETMARRYWQGQRAVGRTFSLAPDQIITIVGVVPDVKYRMLREDAGPSFYLAAAQGRPFPGTFHVKTAGPPEAMLDVLRRALAEADPAVPITRARTLAAQADVNVADERLAMTIALGLALSALLLAAVGLYGAMSFAVSQRQREIGVRIALGAVPADVRRLVLRQGLTLALVGSIAGAGLAIVLARAIESRLFGVAPGDVTSLAVSAAILSAVAIVSTWVPARRAARVNPIEALRTE